MPTAELHQTIIPYCVLLSKKKADLASNSDLIDREG